MEKDFFYLSQTRKQARLQHRNRSLRQVGFQKNPPPGLFTSGRSCAARPQARALRGSGERLGASSPIGCGCPPPPHGMGIALLPYFQTGSTLRASEEVFEKHACVSPQAGPSYLCEASAELNSVLATLC